MAYSGPAGPAGGRNTAPLYVHDRELRDREPRRDRSEAPHPYDVDAPRGRHADGPEGPGASRNRSGDDAYGYGAGGGAKPSPPKRESAVQRLKRRVRTLGDTNVMLTQEADQARHELQHYKDRIVRTEESHRLEIQRLKKEVEYHKRLRQGADQRAFELEDRLMQQLRQTRSFDDNQRLEAEQAMLLHSKNAELQNRVKDLEVQVQQLQGLKECLEEQLDAALYEKEQIEEELQQALSRASHPASFGLGALKIDEDEGDGLEEDEDEQAEGGSAQDAS